MMTDEECGINTFVKSLGPSSEGYVTFDQDDKLYLRSEMIAAADYLVGPGTTCYAASVSPVGKPRVVVKFSWREGSTPAELQLLKRAHERNVWGIISLLRHQELVSIADLRKGLHFDHPFVNRSLSCVATAPLGRPIQKFTSIHELLEVFCDLTKALRSLYVDGRMLHRDIAIKNLVITAEDSMNSSKGMLIDFDQALDLDNVRAVEPMVGSDGFMAIEVLFGMPHTFRHDLESLFYVFLWLAIANDHEHDDAYDILEGLPKTSRLWKWCSLDFVSVGLAKEADMSLDGFSTILDEFSPDFAPLRELAKELHELVFPMRDGRIFTGTDTDQSAAEQLYDEIADAFNQSALVEYSVADLT
ncbi:kinase-like domain-containing protein [Nemania abortiva]|nr:kinase-like domain-containing protein [Nemania abortiva]